MAPELPPGAFVDLDGRGRAFVRTLTGPPGASTIVLLHGLTATADLNWFSVMARLADRYNVLALDQRGHGDGIRSPTFSLEDCADDVAALARTMGFERCVLGGHSMGGAVAQLVWQRHPELVQGLVLSSTSARFPASARTRATLFALDRVIARYRPAHRFVRRASIARAQGSAADRSELQRWAATQLARNDPRSVLRASRALARFSSRGWIQGVDVPCAAVVTLRDDVVPVDRQRDLSLRTRATVLELDEGHGAFVERPLQFADTFVQACAHAFTG